MQITLMRLFSAPEIFIPDAYGTQNRRRKPVPENGVYRAPYASNLL